MTPAQIDLVQTTFEKIRPIADQAAAMFYARLFELDPSLRALFKTDMTEQGKKLMQMIGLAVGNLKNPDAILEPVREMGRRHVGYGVTDAHYDTVAAALLWTLEKGLGPAFTSEARTAWTDTYVFLATEMKAAAGSAKNLGAKG
jgi:hemoglobin-like flavoprotein